MLNENTNIFCFSKKYLNILLHFHKRFDFPINKFTICLFKIDNCVNAV